nr:rod shape-determining protein MreC [Pseudomonadota bacterium]
MVALAGSRPGWSRRAQYGLFFGFVATVAAIIVGLLMLILSLAAPQSYAAVRGFALDVTAPASNALNDVAITATGLVSGAGDYWNAASQNGELKRQRAAMLRRMIEAKAILLENQELKRALALRERDRRTIAAGRVVGSSFT